MHQLEEFIARPSRKNKQNISHPRHSGLRRGDANSIFLPTSQFPPNNHQSVQAMVLGPLRILWATQDKRRGFENLV